MRGNPIKMDDLGVPLFLETPTYRKNLFLQKHPTLGVRDSHVCKGLEIIPETQGLSRESWFDDECGRSGVNG